MSLILPNSSPRVMLDTTVFCGAIRTNGLQRQLLKMARTSAFFTPVVSNVCLLEFYRNAVNGLGNVTYEIGEIEGFLNQFIYPIIEEHELVNSIVGRYSLEIVKREGRQIGDVLVELSGCSTDEAETIIKQHGMQKPLRDYDPQDLHVWVTAIRQNCDYIVTSNTRRFPENIGRIERVDPVKFYGLINPYD